mmetsp:Transcript_30260/g.46302  ORF Transcript_30260/g.46302 Transcript_30260/m.46302 type:complete len:563 (-) Transcript_30260:69-1757(-)
MTLNELDTADSVNDFKTANANVVICFSATWCGPCKAAKPAFTAMASQHEADPSIDLKYGIVYEHTLGDGIHQFGVRAFPTYVVYTNNGSREFGRIQGANLEKLKSMIAEAGCKADLGVGNTLGGTGVTVSPEEARAQRLAMFEKKTAAPAPEPVKESSTTDANADTDAPMEIVEDDKKEAPKEEEAKKEDTTSSEDVEMKEEDQEAEPEMVDPTEKLSKEDLTTLTESMGFTLIRAQKGLMNSSSGVEGAVEWLMSHQDDADIDEPIAKVSAADFGDGVARSYKCNTTGKVFSNMANLELHANRTGHTDFSECTEAVKPLTEEEKAAKILEIKALLKAKRTEREEAEKVDDVDREKQRRSMGKEMNKTKEEMDRLARKRETKIRKKEKDNFKRERARIRAEIEKDKLERKANAGKMSSKLGVDGYNPPAIQYDVDADGAGVADVAAHPHKKIKASAAKIDEYISKVSAYRAGGDGGKCLKILIIYVKNVADNPGEDKFKRIKMDNKVYKTKVKPFVGAKALLLAVGFKPAEGGEAALVLSEDADQDLLTQTKQKLEAAFASY